MIHKSSIAGIGPRKNYSQQRNENIMSCRSLRPNDWQAKYGSHVLENMGHRTQTKNQRVGAYQPTGEEAKEMSTLLVFMSTFDSMVIS